MQSLSVGSFHRLGICENRGWSVRASQVDIPCFLGYDACKCFFDIGKQPQSLLLSWKLSQTYTNETVRLSFSLPSSSAPSTKLLDQSSILPRTPNISPLPRLHASERRLFHTSLSNAQYTRRVWRPSSNRQCDPSSIKKAISTYELQGGSANIFINDDGLQLISDEGRQAHIKFYADHNIG